MNSLATDTAGPPAAAHVTDTLDAKIEALLRDWHHNPDLLFAIHPVDGSFLIWSVLSIASVHSYNLCTKLEYHPYRMPVDGKTNDFFHFM